MRILVISSTPWNGANSFGLSYNNIFSGISNLEIANIYCSSGSPENEFNMVCYQVTAESLLKNLKNKTSPSGRCVANHSNAGIERTAAEQKRFNKARILRWQILFWMQDLIWKFGRWNTPELRKFIDGFQPDMIFTPVYFSSHMNDIVQFCKRYTNVPMAGYISDDCYTLRQLNFSLLYWIDRLWKRRKVKKTIDLCEILYVISDIQKREYEKIFRPECKILTKCADFSAPAPEYPAPQGEIKLLYAGNIDAGRRKSLTLIARAVSRLRREGFPVKWDIYTPTPLTAQMKQELSGGHGEIHPPVPYAELLALQKNADILVHAEGLDLKSRLTVHQSFSTKLVDFFEMGKCILAVGTEDVASIQHLIRHDAAIVAQNSTGVYSQLKKLAQNPEIIAEYGKKAYHCGAGYHDKKKMQAMLREDLQKLSGKTI